MRAHRLGHHGDVQDLELASAVLLRQMDAGDTELRQALPDQRVVTDLIVVILAQTRRGAFIVEK